MSSQKLEGAKEARKVIRQYSQCLSSPRVVPLQAYVPNRVGFGAVCCVNNVTCLFMGKNYYAIPYVIRHSSRHFEFLENNPVWSEYLRLAKEFFAQVSFFLEQFVFTGEDDESMIAVIPSEIREMGEQTAPDFIYLAGEF